MDILVLHDNRSNQDRYTTRSHPRMAERLMGTAQEAGWEVHTGWSLCVVPEGYRASSHHKAVTVPHLLEVLGVWVAAYDVRAAAFWHFPTEPCGKAQRGFNHATLQRSGTSHDVGVEALIGYINGEVDFSG